MGEKFLSSTRRRVIGGVIAALAVAAGTLTAPMSAQADVVSVPIAVAQILSDTNALRVAGGLAPLTENAAMDAVAQNWSAQMSANGAMTHNPSYSTQIPAGWTAAGENVAVGFSYTTVVEAWHQSPGHYANIMGPYNAIGIGYYDLNGQRYYTEDFAYYPPTQAAPAPTPTPTPTSSSSPTPTPTSVITPPASVVPAAAAPSAPAPAARPMKCVRWKHHHCTKYQVIKPKVKKKLTRRRYR